MTAESGEAVQFVTVLQDPFERAFEKLHHLDPRIAHRLGVGALVVVVVLVLPLVVVLPLLVLGVLGVAGGIVGFFVLIR